MKTLTKTAVKAALKDAPTLVDAYNSVGLARATFRKIATEYGLAHLLDKKAKQGQRFRGPVQVNLDPATVLLTLRSATSVKAASSTLGVYRQTLEAFVVREGRTMLTKAWLALQETGRGNRGTPKHERNTLLVKAAQSAVSFRELGRAFNITGQRAHDIVARYGHDGMVAEIKARGERYRLIESRGKESDPKIVKAVGKLVAASRSLARAQREARKLGLRGAAFLRIVGDNGFMPGAITAERDEVERLRNLGWNKDRIALKMKIPATRVTSHVSVLLDWGVIAEQPRGRPRLS